MTEPSAQTKPPRRLNLVLVVVLVAAAGLFLMIGMGGVLFAINAMMDYTKSNEPYAGSIVLAEQHPDLIEITGEPLSEGWFVSGSFSYRDGGGSANYSVGLDGPKERGKLHVRASGYDGEWTYYEAYWASRSGDIRVNLLAEPGEAVLR